MERIRPAVDESKLITGLIVGALVPLVGFGILWCINYLLLTFGGGNLSGFRMRSLMVLALCCNLIPFHKFSNRKAEAAMRGVGVMTIVYGILWVILHYKELMN